MTESENGATLDRLYYRSKYQHKIRFKNGSVNDMECSKV